MLMVKEPASLAAPALGAASAAAQSPSAELEITPLRREAVASQQQICSSPALRRGSVALHRKLCYTGLAL